MNTASEDGGCNYIVPYMAKSKLNISNKNKNF